MSFAEITARKEQAIRQAKKQNSQSNTSQPAQSSASIFTTEQKGRLDNRDYIVTDAGAKLTVQEDCSIIPKNRPYEFSIQDTFYKAFMCDDKIKTVNFNELLMSIPENKKQEMMNYIKKQSPDLIKDLATEVGWMDYFPEGFNLIGFYTPKTERLTVNKVSFEHELGHALDKNTSESFRSFKHQKLLDRAFQEEKAKLPKDYQAKLNYSDSSTEFFAEAYQLLHTGDSEDKEAILKYFPKSLEASKEKIAHIRTPDTDERLAHNFKRTYQKDTDEYTTQKSDKDGTLRGEYIYSPKLMLTKELAKTTEYNKQGETVYSLTNKFTDFGMITKQVENIKSTDNSTKESVTNYNYDNSNDNTSTIYNSEDNTKTIQTSKSNGKGTVIINANTYTKDEQLIRSFKEESILSFHANATATLVNTKYNNMDNTKTVTTTDFDNRGLEKSSKTAAYDANGNIIETEKIAPTTRE